MPEELMALQNVSKAFGGTSALREVSLTLRRGEIHCIAGQNGSGKSTLIKVMSGVHKPDAGVIEMAGKRVTAWTPRAAIDAGVQVIYQDFSLFGSLTVAENLALSVLFHERNPTVSRKRINEIARKAIETLGVELDLKREVSTLPVAGKQLVAIARALMSSPLLLIMDEPTTALTGQEIAVLFQVVREACRRGVAILFVSHKIGELLEISDRITVLRNGAVVAAGPVAEFDETAITRAMTGLDHQEERFHYLPRSGSEPRLDVRGLSLKDSFQDLDFSIMPGEIVGLIGLLGSGRTELALTLFGLRPGYTGFISIDGSAVRIRSVQDAIQHGIGYVPEDRLSDGLFFGLSITENILATEIGAASRLRIEWSEELARAKALQRDMHVHAGGERPVDELSGGNQQRVVLARWLLVKPRLLVLNGPTVGVDVGAKAEIHKLIRRLAQDGLGVLLISDDVPELLQSCNRILTMHRGRIVDTFEPGTLREEDISDRLGALQ